MEDTKRVKWLKCTYDYIALTRIGLTYDYIALTRRTILVIISAGPTPLIFRSSVLHKWRGGFVGEIYVPISDYYTAWKKKS